MGRKRTQKEVAELRKVNIRTVKRWVKAGVNIQDDAAIDLYLAQRQHGGPGSLDASHRSAIAINSANKREVDQTRAAKIEVESGEKSVSVDDQVSMLSKAVAQAADDLSKARRAGQPQRIVSLANKTLIDSIAQLADILLSRDKLRQSSDHGYPISDVITVFTLFSELLRWSVFEAMPMTITNALQEKGLITKDLGVVEAIIRQVIKNGLFPFLSDFGAGLPEALLDVKREISLDERQKLSLLLNGYLKVEGA